MLARWAQFSNAVVQNNADYNYDDQISFYDVEQLVNAATALLLNQVIAEAFTVVDGHLAHAAVAGLEVEVEVAAAPALVEAPKAVTAAKASDSDRKA